MPWSARITDLNPIKKIWGDIYRRVYAAGSQFYTVPYLKDLFGKYSNDLGCDIRHNLVKRMNLRYREVLERGGKKNTTEWSEFCSADMNVAWSCRLCRENIVYSTFDSVVLYTCLPYMTIRCKEL